MPSRLPLPPEPTPLAGAPQGNSGHCRLTRLSAQALGAVLGIHGALMAVSLTWPAESSPLGTMAHWPRSMFLVLMAFECVAGLMLWRGRAVAATSALFLVEGLRLVHSGAASEWSFQVHAVPWADPLVMLLVMVASGLALQPAHGYHDSQA